MPTRTAIYPGSFDPLTLGHLNLIHRGLDTFDNLVIAIVHNPNKTPLFSIEERKAMIREAVGRNDRVEVDSFEGLLVDYCAKRKTNTVLRGLRAVQDFEYEFEMAMMNRRLRPELEIIFMMTDDAFFYISSSLVREVAKLGGDVASFVPQVVHERLLVKFPPKDGKSEGKSDKAEKKKK